MVVCYLPSFSCFFLLFVAAAAAAACSSSSSNTHSHEKICCQKVRVFKASSSSNSVPCSVCTVLQILRERSRRNHVHVHVHVHVDVHEINYQPTK